LSSDDWSWYTTEAASLATQYPVDSTKIESGLFQTWAAESLEVATTVVYPGFVFNTDLTEEYIETAKSTLEARMMYGGARLAALIEEIYPTSLTINAFLQ